MSSAIPGYVLKHGNPTPHSIEGVANVIAIPLNTKNLDVFNDLVANRDNLDGHYLDMFLLTLVMANCDSKLGTPACRYPPGDPRRMAFFDAVAALEEDGPGRRKPQLDRIIREGSYYGKTYDKSATQELERARLRVASSAKKSSDQDDEDAMDDGGGYTYHDIMYEDWCLFASAVNPDGYRHIHPLFIPPEELPINPEASSRIKLYIQSFDEGRAAVAMFAIFDPQWNPGEGIEHIIHHKLKRDETNEKRKADRNARTTFVEPYIHLLPDGIRRYHPVFSLDREDYLDKVLSILDGFGPARRKQEDALLDAYNESIERFSSRFNPLNVFTVERANAYLASLDVRGSLLAFDRIQQTLFIHEASDCYCYNHEALFWNDSRNIFCGLREQYLPWQAVPLSLLEMELTGKEQDLMANADNIRIRRPPRQDPRLLEDPIADLQAYNEEMIRAINRNAVSNPEITYEETAIKREKLRQMMLNRLALVWKPHSNLLEGLLVIPKWAHENDIRRFVEPMPVLPGLSVFGSSMVHRAWEFRFDLQLYGSTRTAAIIFFGSLDCYALERCLKLNSILFGPAESGKTFLLHLIINLCSIPGTVVSVSEKSAMADTSHNAPEMYRMVFQEEYEPYVVNAEAAKRNLELVKRRKEILTAQKSERAVLTLVDNVRKKDIVVTPHFYTEVGATNDPVPQGEAALVSRFYTELITEDLESKLYGKVYVEGSEEDRLIKRHVLRRMQGLKYMQAFVWQAINVGALPKISLDVGNAIFDRMLDYLATRGVYVHRKRDVERIYRLARQLCVHDAIMKTWGVPGAPHYDKDFEPSQVKEVMPHLFLTLEHCLFAWTALHPQYIHESHSIVLKAIDVILHGALSRKKTSFQQLKDINLYDSSFHSYSSATQTSIDINYVTINMSKEKFDNMIRKITQHCNTRMNEGQVLSALEELSRTMIRPEQGVYRLIDATELAALKANRWRRKVGANFVDIAEVEFLDKRITEIPVILLDKAHNSISVALGADIDVDMDIMVEAFLMTCIYQGLKPRKLVLGLNESNNALWRALDLTEELITRFSAGRSSLTINNKNYMPPTVQKSRMELYGIDLDKSGRSQLQVEITKDIDEWAAKLHWRACGLPCSTAGKPKKSSAIASHGRSLPRDAKGKVFGIEKLTNYEAYLQDASRRGIVGNVLSNIFKSAHFEYPYSLVKEMTAEKRSHERMETEDTTTLTRKKQCLVQFKNQIRQKRKSAMQLETQPALIEADSNTGSNETLDALSSRPREKRQATAPREWSLGINFSTTT